MSTRRWKSSYEKPNRKGWYECKARDDRWEGGTQFRAWGNGSWWIPLGGDNGEGGWLSSPMGLYQWRGPCYDMNKPKPADALLSQRKRGANLEDGAGGIIHTDGTQPTSWPGKEEGAR